MLCRAAPAQYNALSCENIRIAEWWFLLWLFFRPKIHDVRKRTWGIALGIVVSYLLDAIGILAAFALPGGAWVC